MEWTDHTDHGHRHPSTCGQQSVALRQVGVMHTNYTELSRRTLGAPSARW